MLKRITALALCLVLALGILPTAYGFGREPIVPESPDRCCHTLRVDISSPNYVRPDYDGKLIEITPSGWRTTSAIWTRSTWSFTRRPLWW